MFDDNRLVEQGVPKEGRSAIFRLLGKGFPDNMKIEDPTGGRRSTEGGKTPNPGHKGPFEWLKMKKGQRFGLIVI